MTRKQAAQSNTFEDIVFSCMIWFLTPEQIKYPWLETRPEITREYWETVLTNRRDRMGDTLPSDAGGLIRYVLKRYPTATLTKEGKEIAKASGVSLRVSYGTPDQDQGGEVNQGISQTWLKRLKLKRARWEDIALTVTEKGFVITDLRKGVYIIESWEGIGLSQTQREGRLLEFFQATKTLEGQDKNVLWRLRKKLQAVSGISEDPFISEGGGTYTRKFEMNISKDTWGGVSEYSGGAAGAEDDSELKDSHDLYENSFNIRTGRRR